MYFKLILFVSIVATTYGSSISTYTECPKKNVVTSFNVSKYEGLWYEIRRFPNFFEPNATCVTGDVTTDEDGNSWILDRWINSYTSEHMALKATLKFADANKKNGKLLVRFNITTVDIDYSVLATDYENYALIWSCIPTGIVNGIPQYGGFAWVLGRSVTLSEEVAAIVENLEAEHSIQTNNYEHTSHANCS